MRAPDTAQFVTDLLGGPEKPVATSNHRTAVKICGTRTPDAAKAAIEAGADMIGIILVPGRSRYVSDDVAAQISEVVSSTPRPEMCETRDSEGTSIATGFFQQSATALLHPKRALLVGVFLGTSFDQILDCVRRLNLDVVQLHGTEPLEWARLLPVPVIRRFRPGEVGLGTRGYHVLPLLDSGSGGSGTKLELSAVQRALSEDEDIRCILAGGLNPGNVRATLDALGVQRDQVVVVDVSSGVETTGKQDHDKIRAFIRAVKQN